jgi:hypothetical protein
MINILSIRCGLGFAPFLADATTEFLSDGAISPRVVRQGGNGMILRSEESIHVRHQNRESTLDPQAAHHFGATVRFRVEFFDVRRAREEVILATVDDNLLISFPQSEMWLDRRAVAYMIDSFERQTGPAPQGDEMPEWLKISTGGGRLLLSDQRNGRWVLMGEDHVLELSRRLDSLSTAPRLTRRAPPPALTVKGINIHLQSALKLAQVFEDFAGRGEIEEYEEATPAYLLGVRRATEGLEIRDFDKRVALTAREARKWSEILRHELGKLSAEQAERGPIRTVVADGPGGRWALQWGDELFIPSETIAEIESTSEGAIKRAGNLAIRRDVGYLLVLDPQSGGCVALSEAEVALLGNELAR